MHIDFSLVRITFLCAVLAGKPALIHLLLIIKFFFFLNCYCLFFLATYCAVLFTLYSLSSVSLELIHILYCIYTNFVRVFLFICEIFTSLY